MLRPVILAAVFGMVAVSLPFAANACIVAPYEAVIHSSLPRNLPKDTFVARVVIEAGEPNQMFRGRGGVRARVRQVFQGRQDEEYVLLQRSMVSDCDDPFLNGRSGYLVAVPRGRNGGVLVVDPITVSRSEGFRLPEGYQMSEEMRTGHIIVDLDAIEKANKIKPQSP